MQVKEKTGKGRAGHLTLRAGWFGLVRFAAFRYRSNRLGEVCLCFKKSVTSGQKAVNFAKMSKQESQKSFF
ncbi:MAG: hypothetical protein OXC57_05475 [Rhodobacteraceae bacterium]|nr:hypothetical protein [Paracoccaceae bacterium]